MLRKAIARITLITSTSAEFCFNMPLMDFIEFNNSACEEAALMRKEAGSGGKQKGT